MKKRKYKIKYWLAPCLWGVGILVGTSIPGNYLPPVDFPGLDKSLHILLYCGLALLTQWVLEGRLVRPSVRTISITAIICACFGFLDEFHQIFVPDRTFSLGDLFASLIGVFIGLIITLILPAKGLSKQAPNIDSETCKNKSGMMETNVSAVE